MARRLIKSIRIEKFRSLNKQDIACEAVTIFSGKNNSGKSNILKALNLFFNGESSYDSPYQHSKDFNIAFTGHMPGRREIVITVNFFGQGSAALKDDFSITRRFGRTEIGPYEYHSTNKDIEAMLYPGEGDPDGNVMRQFTTFKNKTNYIYVPAVRDKAFVRRLFQLFEMVINGTSKKTFDRALSSLNKVLDDKSRAVSRQFEEMMRLSTRAKLSTSPEDVLDAIGIEVESGISVRKHNDEIAKQFVDLFSTGDGILMSYVPHFLNYIANEQTNRNFIWGFEEPENSLEYAKTQVLARKFVDEFSKTSQIFLTTHSPAFINLETKPHTAIYRVFINPLDDKRLSQVVTIQEMQQRLLKTGDSQRDLLSEELGNTKLSLEVERHISEFQQREKELKDTIDSLTRPIIYSEGNNLVYLSVAKGFFDPEGDYEIVDCGGKKRMKNLYDQASVQEPRHKMVFIWDADCSGYRDLAETEAVLPIVLDSHRSNRFIVSGIEASLPESEVLSNKSRFYTEEALPNGGTKTILRKSEVEKLFCQQNVRPENFEAFESVFANIKRFLAQ